MAVFNLFWNISVTKQKGGGEQTATDLLQKAVLLLPVWQVYNFLDKMSFYTQVYKHKPNDIIAKEDETLWRRLTPKLLYPLSSFI